MVAGKLDIAKKQHRERSQPVQRKRLGLLEKHKDYVKRARDYHAKKDKIKALQTKASQRNKDEFYFGMIKAKTRGGIHVQDRGNTALPQELVQVLKTQDAKYIERARASEAKRIASVKAQLAVLIDVGRDEETARLISGSAEAGPSKPSKTIFVDTLDQMKRYKPQEVRSSKTKPGAAPEDEDIRAAQAAKHRTRLQLELKARLERDQGLARAQRELELTRQLMRKGSKKLLDRSKAAGEESSISRAEEEDDEIALRQMRNGARLEGLPQTKLPEPHQREGVTTGARVWKWKNVRQR